MNLAALCCAPSPALSLTFFTHQCYEGIRACGSPILQMWKLRLREAYPRSGSWRGRAPQGPSRACVSYLFKGPGSMNHITGNLPLCSGDSRNKLDQGSVISTISWDLSSHIHTVSGHPYLPIITVMFNYVHKHY